MGRKASKGKFNPPFARLASNLIAITTTSSRDLVFPFPGSSLALLSDFRSFELADKGLRSPNEGPENIQAPIRGVGGPFNRHIR